MNELIQSLKSYIIISLQDLTHIKNTIASNYKHLSSVERAEILSLAIHTHLDKHLIGIDADYKEALRFNILENTLAKHVYLISRHDVFESILGLDLPESTRVGLAETWLSETVQIPVPRWALEDFLYSRSPNIRQNSSKVESTFNNEWRYKMPRPLTYDRFNRSLQKHFLKFAMGLFLLISVFSIKSFVFDGLNIADRPSNASFSSTQNPDFEIDFFKSDATFEYRPFDYFKVKYYISNTRDGLIGDSDHFNQILHKAYINDIDPLLLLAIIGQEQAFVPNTEVAQTQIINNPYNVFHSWKVYNTNLRDSTQVAINTIKNRLAIKPMGISPFEWLNHTYAEDQAWHVGVKSIYEHLVLIGR